MNPISTWDFTCFNNVSETEVCDCLKLAGRDWVFQLEKTDQQKLHYQGRIRLYKKIRLTGVVKLFDNTVLKNSHWSPTSNPGTRDFNYVMKLDRVKGPWTNMTMPQPKPLDVMFIDKVGPRPFMLQMKKWSDERKDTIDRRVYVSDQHRKIRFIVGGGGVGKSHAKRWGLYYNLWKIIPATNSAKDIVATALEFNHWCYVVDCPRAMNWKKCQDFFGALEMVKSGDLFDGRYKPRQENLREQPELIVLGNSAPPTEWLSADRIDVYHISEGDFSLTKVTPS